MNIVLTGSTGYIGSAVLAALLEHGHDVTALVRSEESAKKVVADSKKYGNFDDEFIYEQFAKPAADRSISQQSLLRPEAVEVWKEYSNRQDMVDY